MADFLAYGGLAILFGGVLTGTLYAVTAYLPVAAETVYTPLVRKAATVMLGVGLIVAFAGIGLSESETESDVNSVIGALGVVSVLGGFLLFFVAAMTPERFAPIALTGAFALATGFVALAVDVDPGDGGGGSEVPDDPTTILDDGGDA